MKKISRVATAGAWLALCLVSTQCEKYTQLRSQKAELHEKFEKMRMESAELDRKLTEARQALPPKGTLEEAARELEAKAKAEIASLEANFKAAAAALKQTEADIAALRQQHAASKSQVAQ